MRRKEGCFRLYAVQLPELLRRCPGLLAENRDKVADIAVAAEGCDAVERSVGTADEKLLGAADAQNADVRADRAADKTLEQACQILRRDMELFREIIHIERDVYKRQAPQAAPTAAEARVSRIRFDFRDISIQVSFQMPSFETIVIQFQQKRK